MKDRRREGWYYVGNGQLRFMDPDGWTDRYRNIDDPEPVSHPEERGPGPSVQAQQGPTARSSTGRTWLVVTTVAAVTAAVVSAAWSTGVLGGDPPEALSSQAPRPTAKVERDQVTAVRPLTSTSPTVQSPAVPMLVADEFRQEKALAEAGDIIANIGLVDERLDDGALVDSALIVLSASYGRLAQCGVPPHLDRADYLTRVNTLQSLAARAADSYEAEPTKATATYLMVREETLVVLAQINGAIGTDLSLPPPTLTAGGDGALAQPQGAGERDG